MTKKKGLTKEEQMILERITALEEDIRDLEEEIKKLKEELKEKQEEVELGITRKLMMIEEKKLLIKMYISKREEMLVANPSRRN